jgi:hypothetical protein
LRAKEEERGGVKGKGKGKDTGKSREKGRSSSKRYVWARSRAESRAVD